MLVSRREKEEVEVRHMNREWEGGLSLRQGEKSLLAS